MHFNSLLNMIGFSGKAHRGSPAFGRVTTKMRVAGGPSQVKRTPVSAVTYPCQPPSTFRGARGTGAATARRLPAWLLPVLLVLALVAASAIVGRLLPADPAWAQGDSRPKITAGPSIASNPTSGDAYRKGESITVTVTFSEAVTVEGEPRVRLDVGERERWARYSSADGATLIFSYTVKGSDRDDDGVSIRKNALGLNQGTITDADGNAARLKHPGLAAQAGHKVTGSLVDYDPDNDGLISVGTQQQLAAITLDLDGDGAPDSGDDAAKYSEAFPNAIAGMGCPEGSGCAGYELAVNLTLTGSWSPIGANGAGFTGTFDGNTSTISGLTGAGLFALLGEGGVIRDVGLITPTINRPSFERGVGALAGENHGTISGSYVSGGTIAASGKGDRVGGLVGNNRGGSVSDSHSSANVKASGRDSSVGGLVGWSGSRIVREDLGWLDPNRMKPSIISGSHASGDVNVTGRGSSVGGLVGTSSGALLSRATISDSHASGNVIASGTNSAIGGLIGENTASTVSGSHASGGASASGKSSTVGGLVGTNVFGTFIDCYASGNASTSAGSNHMVGGLVGWNRGGTVRDSRAKGGASASGKDSYVGGLMGLNDGTVSNSHASGDASTSGGSNHAVGGLVGWNRSDASVSNSHASGNASTSGGGNEHIVGGLMGLNDGTVSNSHASGDASTSGGSNHAVGGLVGMNRAESSVIYSHATGNVSTSGGGNEHIVGGLVGINWNGSVSNSYAIGSVSASKGDDQIVGGLVGKNWGGSVSNSYAVGSASASGENDVVGGLVGWNRDGSVSNSYWDKKTTGVTTSDGSPRKAGKTTKQMKKATGPSSNIYTGWDPEVWDFSDPTDYPTLR